ncbi:MAG TPA: dephospho-CoA kinase [Trueperaceae bacterium]
MSRQPRRIGLTGNIGAGKSTAARLLADRGAVLIDADALARQATDDPAVLTRIAMELGDDLVLGGRLDRAATAAKVFADPGARQALNDIVHPWVRQQSAERAAALERQAEPPDVILFDIPLLYENGLEQGLDAVVVVVADPGVRLARVRARSGLTEEAFRARDRAQLPLAEKAARADYVLDNNGSLEALEAQVDALWPKLAGRSG